MVAKRDPLSVHYDRTTGRVLRAAADAWSRRAGVKVWVASPVQEYAYRDRGGLTKHERAFTRSSYYRIVELPKHLGQGQVWSLKLTWQRGREKRGNRWGRVVTVRLFKYRRRATAQIPRGRSWLDNDRLKSRVGTSDDVSERGLVRHA